MRTFLEALQKPGMSYICEVKKASPSKGLIAPDFPYTAIAKEYEDSGASAISCLTEPFWFLGSDRYLEAITDEVMIPVLRKDFTVDPYMIAQARSLGASAVLLICALLDDTQLKDYRQYAESFGMDALVEAHDEEEVQRALGSGAKIIGVNNRNLKDFSIDLQTTERLSRMVPQEKLLVAESGIVSDEDVEFLKACGVNAFLIGRAFMEAEHPGEVAARWKQR